MGKGNFSDNFKRDAVAQITERGYPVFIQGSLTENIRNG
jgi:transposase-like protein